MLSYLLSMPCFVKPASMPKCLLPKQTWTDSPPTDMLHSAVSVLVLAQPNLEFPEGLMNYPVLCKFIRETYIVKRHFWQLFCMAVKRVVLLNQNTQVHWRGFLDQATQRTKISCLSKHSNYHLTSECIWDNKKALIKIWQWMAQKWHPDWSGNSANQIVTRDDGSNSFWKFWCARDKDIS
jgi:hypothetical protein